MGTVGHDPLAHFHGQEFEGPDGRAAYGKYQVALLPTFALVEAYATRFGTALHAGGHLGLLSLALATRFTQVITYEVAEDNFGWLAANVAQEPRIDARYGALGDGEPVACVRAKYSMCHYAHGPGVVPCTRIDNLGLESLDLLLLDLEGGEVVALQHALETIQRCRPLIICEEWPRWFKRYGRQSGDVTTLLATVGYRLVGTSPLDLAFLPKPEEGNKC